MTLRIKFLLSMLISNILGLTILSLIWGVPWAGLELLLAFVLVILSSVLATTLVGHGRNKHHDLEV
jgi:hypothetical protein